jgi:cyclic pyranopterin phosphate synthase
MPEEEYVWLPRESILTFEELTRLTSVFAAAGVHKVRLTGGEPLLRQDLPDLVAMLARVEGVTDLALTTNGLLLERQAGALARAGLGRVTVSLDTLKPDRFKRLTRSARHGDVLRGIAAAREAGFGRIKLNAVIIRGFNEDELVDLMEFGRQTGGEVRFIEYMDVGGATHWTSDRVFGRSEMLAALAAHYGEVTSRPRSEAEPTAPAEEFLLPDGTAFGIIASTTAPFCRDCDRSRLTADGVWFLCLYAEQGLDLRRLLRGGATDQDLISVLVDAWTARADRGAEERTTLQSRGALYQIERLRADPHREMHTRGG